LRKSRQQSIKDFTIFKDKKENDKSTVYSSTPEKSKAKKASQLVCSAGERFCSKNQEPGAH
jgi:hypothetical protein